MVLRIIQLLLLLLLPLLLFAKKKIHSHFFNLQQNRFSIVASKFVRFPRVRASNESRPLSAFPSNLDPRVLEFVPRFPPISPSSVPIALSALGFRRGISFDRGESARPLLFSIRDRMQCFWWRDYFVSWLDVFGTFDWRSGRANGCAVELRWWLRNKSAWDLLSIR